MLAALTIGISMRIVGILLIAALMVLPVIAAQRVAWSLRSTMGLAVGDRARLGACRPHDLVLREPASGRHDRADGDRALPRGGRARDGSRARVDRGAGESVGRFDHNCDEGGQAARLHPALSGFSCSPPARPGRAAPARARARPARAFAIRVVVPGQPGAQAGLVSAPPYKVSFGADFAYPEDGSIAKTGAITTSATSDVGSRAIARAERRGASRCRSSAARSRPSR